MYTEMKSTLPNDRQKLDMAWQAFLMFAVVLGAMMIPVDAFATSTNGISIALCNAVLLVKGPAGKAIATVAIIVIGLGALMGKVSWGMALIVALGIALIFGAASIVDVISGDSTLKCQTTVTSVGS